MERKILLDFLLFLFAFLVCLVAMSVPIYAAVPSIGYTGVTQLSPANYSEFSAPSPNIATFEVNITDTDGGDDASNILVYLYFNDTLVNETENNVTLDKWDVSLDLSAGLWNITWYTEDDGGSSDTEEFWYQINKSSTSLLNYFHFLDTRNTGYLNTNATTTYPLTLYRIFVYWNVPYATEEYNMQLLRNGTVVAESEYTETWCTFVGLECVRNFTHAPAGHWNYTAVKNATENYTAFSNTYFFIVNQNSSFTTRLYLNGTENDKTYYQGDRINITATTNSSLFPTVYIDSNITGWIILSGATSKENITYFESGEGGVFNITAYNEGNENYTASSVTYYITLIPASYTVLNETYNRNATEGDTEYFEMFINTTVLSDVNATFYYNGTSYTATRTKYEISSNNSHYKFSRSLALPLISDVSEDVTFNFTYTVFFFNGTNITSGTDHTQTINKIYITNCSAGGFVAMEINIYDEMDRSSLNATIELAFDLWKGNQNLIENYSFVLQGHYNYSICIYPSWEDYRMDAFMEARNLPSFPRRHRWLFNVSLSNTTQTVNIYLLNSTSATFMYMYVQDQSGQAEEDILVQVQRYYISADAFVLVAEGLSNFDGLANTYLQLNDIYYKFILKTKEGVIQRTFDPFLVTDNELTLPITDEPIGEWFEFNQRSSYSCSYNNNTRYLSCSFSDTSGTATKHCLGVRQIGIMINTTICDESTNCESTASGTLTCYLADNTTGKVYQYILIRHGSEAAVASGILDFVIITAIYGLSGVFITVVLFLTLSFIGLYSPAASLFLGVLAIIIAYITRILSISLGSIIGLALMVGIILYLMKSR